MSRSPILAREPRRKVGVVLSGSLQYRSEYRSTFSHRCASHRRLSRAAFRSGGSNRRAMRQGRRDGALPGTRSWQKAKAAHAYAIVSQRVVQVTTLRGCQPRAQCHHCTHTSRGPPSSFPPAREIHVHYIVFRHALHDGIEKSAFNSRETRNLGLSDFEADEIKDARIDSRCNHNVCMFVFVSLAVM